MLNGSSHKYGGNLFEYLRRRVSAFPMSVSILRNILSNCVDVIPTCMCPLSRKGKTYAVFLQLLKKRHMEIYLSKFNSEGTSLEDCLLAFVDLGIIYVVIIHSSFLEEQHWFLCKISRS